MCSSDLFPSHDMARVKSMLDYAQEETNCRSQVLLSYFGEKNTQPCGQCDICLKNKENTVSDDEFSAIAKQIFELLEAEPAVITSLVRKSGLKEQKILKVIRFLLDDGKLVEDNFGRLKVK